MKIRTKLIIGIILIIVVPIFVVAPFINMLFNNFVFGSLNGFASPNDELVNHLVISNELVNELCSDGDKLYTENEIIQIMDEFREERLSNYYRYYITKGDKIIAWSKNLDNNEIFKDYVYESDFNYSSNNTNNGYINGNMYGIGVASFIYEDGSYGKVSMFFKPSFFYRGMLIYNVTIIAAMLFVIIVTAILLLIWIGRSMNKQLEELEIATEALIEGNHDKAISMSDKSDFYSLAKKFDILRLSLKESIEAQTKLEDEKRRIISNISHDIRTPLTSIRAYAQGVRTGVANTEEKRNEYLEIIEGRVEVVESILQDLRMLEMYDGEENRYNKVNVDINSFIMDASAELGQDVKQVGGELIFESSDEKQEVLVDVDKLYRVYANIVSNSIKYKSSQPLKIYVSTEKVQSNVKVRIEDNGLGVSKNEIDNIFERFYRVDKSRSQNISGSGLGLSICKEIIEDHEGRINAKYKENGLIIEFELPIVK